MPKSSAPFRPLAPDLWLASYELKMLGVDLQRNVTVIRLKSGKLVIHSTAPFSAGDVVAIRALGEPVWLVDALLRHDTFAKEGTAAFPHAAYLAPPGFAVPSLPLIDPPPEWAGELDVIPVDGAPEFGEIVLVHRASRTLVVCDLVFNFPGGMGLFGNLLLKLASVGGHHAPGVTRPFKKAIKDPAAYAASVRAILDQDFDRVIVGHGSPIETGGKDKLRAAFRGAGIGGV